MTAPMLARLRELLAAASGGNWTAYRMVHEDHGGDLSPDEAGEYVRNSVVRSAAESGSNAFMAVLVDKPDGPADVCHVGNGPTSRANCALIAEMRNALPALLAVAEAADHLRDREDCGMGCGTDLGPIFAAVDPLRKGGA